MKTFSRNNLKRVSYTCFSVILYKKSRNRATNFHRSNKLIWRNYFKQQKNKYQLRICTPLRNPWHYGLALYACVCEFNFLSWLKIWFRGLVLYACPKQIQQCTIKILLEKQHNSHEKQQQQQQQQRDTEIKSKENLKEKLNLKENQKPPKPNEHCCQFFSGVFVCSPKYN